MLASLTRNGALTAALLAWSCGGAEVPSAPASTGAEEPDSERALPIDAPGPAASVALVDSGGEPRRPLRYHPQEGASGESHMRITIDLGVRVNDHPISGSEFYAMAAMTTRVARVHADGRVRREWTLATLSAKGDVATVEPARSERARLIGTRGWELLDGQGRMLMSAYDKPDQATAIQLHHLDQIRAGRQTLAVPLPQEPVGVGARWRATTRLTTRYVRALEATYTLESLEGERAVVTVDGKLTGKRQELDLDGGRTSVLAHLDGRLHGRVSIRLDGLQPTADLWIEEHREHEVGRGSEMTFDSEKRLQSTPVSAGR